MNPCVKQKLLSSLLSSPVAFKSFFAAANGTAVVHGLAGAWSQRSYGMTDASITIEHGQKYDLASPSTNGGGKLTKGFERSFWGIHQKKDWLKGAMLTGIVSLIASVALGGDIQGKVTIEGRTAHGSSVVYLDTSGDTKIDPPAEHAVIHQKQLTFFPHVVAIARGTTVDFWNDDSVQHGVSWPSVGNDKKLGHHLGVWTQGGMKSFTFNDLGVIPLLCYLHPQMSAYIVVLATPHFATTDETGSFVIHDVPPGDYLLKVWNEDGEPAAQQLQVKDSTTSVNVTVKRAHHS